MLNIIKSQVTNENRTTNDGGTTEPGVTSASRTDTGTATVDPETDTPPTTEPSTQPPIGLDEVFGLLKNRRRRDVLRHLVEHDTEVRLGELAEQIAARECEKDVTQIDSQERKRVYVGLYQCHLPKLDDVGVIDYDKPRGILERGPAFEHITHYLPAEETPADATAPDHSLIASLSNLVSPSRFSL